MGAPARFYLIAKAYLTSKGENIDAIPDKDLAKQFGLYGGTIAVARKKLTKVNGDGLFKRVKNRTVPALQLNDYLYKNVPEALR